MVPENGYLSLYHRLPRCGKGKERYTPQTLASTCVNPYLAEHYTWWAPYLTPNGTDKADDDEDDQKPHLPHPLLSSPLRPR